MNTRRQLVKMGEREHPRPELHRVGDSIYGRGTADASTSWFSPANPGNIGMVTSKRPLASVVTADQLQSSKGSKKPSVPVALSPSCDIPAGTYFEGSGGSAVRTYIVWPAKGAPAAS